MKIRLLAALALAFLLPAAAGAQEEAKPSAPAIDPLGKYAVQAVVQGQAMDFEMVIEKKEDGTYGGKLVNPNLGETYIASLKVEGRTMKMVLSTPQGAEAVAEVTIAEDGTLDGSWSMQGDGGKMTGKKLP